MKALTLRFVWNIRAKLRAEGDKLWAEAVIEVHGNVFIKWTNDGCIVEGEKFANVKEVNNEDPKEHQSGTQRERHPGPTGQEGTGK